MGRFNRICVAAAIAISTVVSSGCAHKTHTLVDAQSAKGTGTIREYAKPVDEVWQAVLVAVKKTPLKIVSEDKEKGEILATRGMDAWTWGEKVAIYVEPVAGKNRTAVEVISKRAVDRNIGATDWEPVIFEELSKRILPARDYWR